MKRILVSSTLVTTAFAVALLLVPSRAHAATAHEKFASMRSALARAFSAGELTISGMLVDQDTASFNVKLYGSPLPPDVPVEVSSTKLYGYTDYTVTVDLSDSNFSSITFGKDQNTLKLVPKSKPDQVDIVRLDPKTGSPLAWTEYKNGSTKPETSITYKIQAALSTNNIRVVSKSTAAELADIITAHIRFVTK